MEHQENLYGVIWFAPALFVSKFCVCLCSQVRVFMTRSQRNQLLFLLPQLVLQHLAHLSLPALNMLKTSHLRGSVPEVDKWVGMFPHQNHLASSMTLLWIVHFRRKRRLVLQKCRYMVLSDASNFKVIKTTSIHTSNHWSTICIPAITLPKFEMWCHYNIVVVLLLPCICHANMDFCSVNPFEPLFARFKKQMKQGKSSQMRNPFHLLNILVISRKPNRKLKSPCRNFRCVYVLSYKLVNKVKIWKGPWKLWKSHPPF